MVVMKKALLSILTLIISFGANADLEQAIAYAEVGEVDKAHMELYNISQRAMSGNPKSMCEFGTMYKKEGYWIVQSDEDASEWWLKSAEMGYAPCQFSIGAAYLIGSGVDKDLSQAKRWLQLAIDSTYEKYSRSAKVLYAAHELDKVPDEPMDIYYKMPTFLLDD
jgi:TPR repeat protein